MSNAPAVLKARVQELLKRVNALRRHILAHDFDQARLEAQALELYCAGTTVLANKLADET